jgi:amino acid transporter
MLLTYAYSYMFIILGSSYFNALIFGSYVYKAATPNMIAQEHRLVRLFAVTLVSAVCVLQSYSRMNHIIFSNIFAIYKVVLLTVLTVMGWVALANVKHNSARTEAPTTYGPSSFHRTFRGLNASKAYAIALAFLIVLRAYSGYETANFVLEEVRRPPGDEDRVFRRSALITSAMITVFYVCVNISLVRVSAKGR